MFFQAGHLGKAFRATIKFAGIRSFACVRSNVIFEISSCRESFTTIRIGTYKGSFSSMYSLVNIEMLGCVKSFATAWKITFARSIRNMDLLYM